MTVTNTLARSLTNDSSHDFDPSFHHGPFPATFPPMEATAPGLSIPQLRKNLLHNVNNALITLSSQRLSAEDKKKNIEEVFSSQIRKCKTGGGPGDPTILHWLAKKIDTDDIRATDAMFKAAGTLAEIATSMDPAMLSTQDGQNGSTPIHLFAALSDTGSAQKGLGEIILRMCRAAERLPLSDPKNGNHAARAIASQNTAKENCLHVAVRKKLAITEALILISPADAVLATRDGGNTPLHDAVDPNCLNYHERACHNKDASGNVCNICMAETGKMSTESRHTLGAVAALITKQPKVLMEKNGQDLSPYLLHQQPRKQATRNKAVVSHAAASVVDKDGTVTGPTASTASTCEVIPSDALDKDIERYLVESALSLGGFEDACRCFFGKTNHSQALHTIFRLERPLTGFDSEKMYSFFQCGNTLAQVDVSIDPTDAADRKIKGAPVEVNPLLLGDAKAALFNVFKMLKEKKVKRILKLKVRDNQQAPCSDEFIEACLKDFDIRYLDWNKPNLCSDVVIASAPRVAEVWLYSTGTTSVLRSWAGSNGLANLRQLRVLHLYTEMGLESHTRHLLDVTQFEEELRKEVRVARKLKIIARKEAINKAAIKKLEREVADIKKYRADVQADVQKLDQKTVRSTNPTEDDVKKLKWLEEAKNFYRQQLELRTKNLEREQQEPAKFREGKTALLDARQQDLENMVSRVSRRTGNAQPTYPADTKVVLSGPPTKIDISGMSAWGVTGVSEPAFDIDFVALEFAIDRTTPEPSSKSGGKLVMKPARKDDETSFKQHRWVKSLQNFVSTYVQASDKNTRIKIALIDDGVDAEQQDLRSIVKGGWPTEEPTSSGTPFYQSTEGHGTTMARLIAIACPHVDLYVAKLKSLNKVVSRDDRWRLAADDSSDVWTSTADEAAKAIQWARSQGVHIISMSWTLIETEHNTDEISRLKRQIAGAASDNIIMYCAAADQGLYGGLKKLYPAGSDAAIRVVGSATETGQSSGFVNQDQVDYLFPGEEFQEIGNRRGSSAATALAAGFTALILWCYEASERNAKLTQADRQRMRNPEYMHYMFDNLQSLVHTAGAKSNTLQNKWVDASILLDNQPDGEGIDRVVDRVDSEFIRRGKGGPRIYSTGQ